MNLIEKIEAIRREPEPVRMRYVAASVSVIMFFVIALWIFSLASSLQATLPRVTEGTKRVTESVTPPTSLQNLIDEGKQLERQDPAAPSPTTTKDSSIIRQLDPNFGEHPTEDTAPKDSSLPILAPNTSTGTTVPATSPKDTVPSVDTTKPSY